MSATTPTDAAEVELSLKPTAQSVRRRRGSLQRKHIEHNAEQKAEIHIRHDSQLFCCCGPHDHHARHVVHEAMEHRWVQMFLLALLCIDVVVVALEIALKYRIILAGPDLHASSLYLPKEYVCASPSEVEYKWGYPILDVEPGTLEDCCIDFNLKYPVTDIWGTGKIGNNTLNVLTCMNRTLWKDPRGMNESHVDDKSSAHRRLYKVGHEKEAMRMRELRKHYSHRMLLSSSGSASGSVSGSVSGSGHHYEEQLERCYDYPNHKYKPTMAHLPFETACHWISTIILLVFLVELLCLMYAMRVTQFFCACAWSVHEGDVVVVHDSTTGDILLAHGLVVSLNKHTGHATIRPINLTDINTKSSSLNAAAKHKHKHLHTGGHFAKSKAKQATKLPDYLQEAGTEEKYPTHGVHGVVGQKEGSHHDHQKHHYHLQRTASLAAINDTALLAGEHQTLTDIPHWSIELWSFNRARQIQMGTEDPGDDDDDEISLCRMGCSRWNIKSPSGGRRCCFTWFNRFFVLDFVVVVAALVMENMQQILENFAFHDMDTTVLTEAAVFLIIVRGWRVLRVFHGAWEASKKVSDSMFDVKMELRLLVDQGLYEMVVRKHELEKGTISHKEFYAAFCSVFGNIDHPDDERATHGEGHNYIRDISNKLKEVANTTQEVKKASSHTSLQGLMGIGSEHDLLVETPGDGSK